MVTATNDDKGATAAISDAHGRYSDVEITTGALVLDDETDGVIRERGRSVALGEWTSPTFNAANFTSSAGAWTVGSGDVVTYAYTLVGLTMTLTVWLEATSVSGTPQWLGVAVPDGYTIAKSVLTAYAYSDDGGPGSIGYFEALANTRVVRCYKPGGTNWLNATNLTVVAGQIVLQVLAPNAVVGPPGGPGQLVTP